MNRRKIKEIVKFDLEKNTQNKWFVILNIVILIAVLFATNMDNIKEFLSAHDMNFMEMEDVTIEVLDTEDVLFGELEKQTQEIEQIKLEKVEKNLYSKENIPPDNLVLIETMKDEEELIKIKLVSKEGISEDVYNLIYEAVKETRNIEFANKHNITVDELEVLSSEPSIERVFLGVDAENSETKEMIKTFSILIVYMVLIMVTSQIASTIAQEKTSKSIEYVLTSVSAKEYLLAKVLGVTLTIIIQVVYSAVYYMIGNLINTLITMQSISSNASFTESFMANVDVSIISYVLVMAAYLIFTVFLVSLVQATLSSKTTSMSEAGNTTMLILFVVVFLYIISLGAISPYTNVTMFMYIVSCIPVVSTFFVPAMMIIGQAKTIQIIISFVVLIITSPLIFNICSKYFKNGILDYTSKKKGLFGKKKEEEKDFRTKQEYELKLKIAKKFSFTIGMALIIFVFLQTVLGVVLTIGLPSLLEDTFDTNTILVLVNGLVSPLSMIGSIAFIKVYNNDKTEKEKTDLSGKKKFNIIFTGVALIGLAQLLLPYVYEWFGINYDALDKMNMVPGNGSLSNIIFFIVLAVLPAIFEELLCRKYILNSAKKYGNVFAVLFSALVFAIIHMNLSQAIFAFIIGVVFAVIAIKTNSIKIPVLLHFLNNSYAALLTIFDGNQVATSLVNNVALAIMIFAVIILIKNLLNLKNIKKEDLKLNSDCKLILRNYTFILAVALLLIMFLATESMLKFM